MRLLPHTLSFSLLYYHYQWTPILPLVALTAITVSLYNCGWVRWIGQHYVHAVNNMVGHVHTMLECEAHMYTPRQPQVYRNIADKNEYKEIRRENMREHVEYEGICKNVPNHLYNQGYTPSLHCLLLLYSQSGRTLPKEREGTGRGGQPPRSHINGIQDMHEGIDYKGELTSQRGRWGIKPPIWKAPAPHEPIDIVYLWVSGTSKEWEKRWKKLISNIKKTRNDNALSMQRFMDGGELKHSLRSLIHNGLSLNIGTIYIITGSGTPPWLSTQPPLPSPSPFPPIVVVDQHHLIPWPTYNTNALFAFMHHIPNLSDHFISWDDDVFLDGPVTRVWWLRPTRPRFFCERFHNACLDAHSCSNYNANRLLVKEFGGRLEDYKTLYHTPVFMYRPLLEWLSVRYRAELTRTVRNQVRDRTDINIKQLYAWYVIRMASSKESSYCEVVGSRRAHYEDPAKGNNNNNNNNNNSGSSNTYKLAASVDVSAESMQRGFEWATINHYTFLNLNNNDLANNSRLEDFLARRYPWKGSFEKDINT